MTNDYEHFKFLKKNGLIKLQTEEDHLRLLANRLLECLYKPSKNGFVPDWNIIKRMKINSEEPINWADLSTSVQNMQDYYLVTIEEASPDSCQTLCDYIEKWLIEYGWIVQVETEW